MKFKKINPNIIMILVIAVLVIGGLIGVSVIKGSKNNDSKGQGAVAQNVESVIESQSGAEKRLETEDQETSGEKSLEGASEETSTNENNEEASKESSGEKDKESSASKKETTAKNETTATKKETTTAASKKTAAATKKETTATAKKETTAAAKKETTASSKKDTTAATKKETTATAKKETTAAAKKETTASSKKDTTAATKKETTAAPTKPAKKTCTITIRCDTILNNMGDLTPGKEGLVPSSGYILSKKTVEFDDGETVFDVLKEVCSNAGIQLEYAYTPAYNSYYIEGINNLYEFDCGSESGWMYKVNGWFPNYGCSSYTLKDGDAIVWCYTCKGLGADVGAN